MDRRMRYVDHGYNYYDMLITALDVALDGAAFSTPAFSVAPLRLGTDVPRD